METLQERMILAREQLHKLPPKEYEGQQGKQLVEIIKWCRIEQQRRLMAAIELPKKPLIERK